MKKEDILKAAKLLTEAVTCLNTARELEELKEITVITFDGKKLKGTCPKIGVILQNTDALKVLDFTRSVLSGRALENERLCREFGMDKELPEA